MLKLFFNLAIRSLGKNGWYIFASSLSLAIGMACYMIVDAYVYEETTYEYGNEHHSNVYRLTQVIRTGQKDESEDVDTPMPLGPLLLKHLPEVVNFFRIHRYRMPREYSADNQNFLTFNEVYLADPGVFDLLDLQILKGTPQRDFIKNGQVALSESTAMRLFGSTDVVGRKLYTSTKFVCRVAGVFKDINYNSHLPLGLILSIESLKSIWNPKPFTSWQIHSSATYIKTREPIEDLMSFEQHINSIAADSIKEMDGWSFKIMPIADIHFHSHKPFEYSENADIRLIYFLQAMSVFLVLLTLISFINLFSINLTQKLKGIILLKHLGSSNRHLFVQGLVEVALICVPAFLLTISIIVLSSDLIKHLSDDVIDLKIIAQPRFYFQATGWFILAALLTASLSFLVLTHKRLVLGSGFKSYLAKKITRFQRVLMGVQLAVTLTLMNGAIFLNLQTSFMLNSQFGLNMNDVLVIKLPAFESYAKRIKVTGEYRKILEKQPSVHQVTTTYCIPGTRFSGFTVGMLTYKQDSTTRYRDMTYSHGCDDQYIPLLGIKLLAGRNFVPNADEDKKGIIINRELCQLLGFNSPDDAIDKKVSLGSKQPVIGKIVGVVENVHYLSLKEERIPIYLTYGPNVPIFALVKSKPGATEKAREEIKETFESFYQGRPLKLFSLAYKYNMQYEDDIKISQIVAIFSIVAILLSCSGLFTITLYSLSRKSKEIAIRKINGAQLKNIFIQMSKPYIYITLWAFSVATPIAYWIMRSWLENFAHRIELNPVVFIISGCTILLLVLAIISYEIFKAAISPPVRSLRNE